MPFLEPQSIQHRILSLNRNKKWHLEEKMTVSLYNTLGRALNVILIDFYGLVDFELIQMEL